MPNTLNFTHKYSEKLKKRKPLSLTAKRAGWIGCNILLETIPQSGKIFYIKDSKVQSKNEIVDNWNKTIFLKENKNLDSRGWLLDIMKCIEKMDKKDFSLSEIYQFENYLGLKHPNNNNIQAKIRQQLQNLRDKNFLEFSSRGKYKLR